MGGTVAVSTDISRPADEVWAMVADVTRMGEWSPETGRAQWVAPAAGPAVGARFRGTNHNGSKTWSTRCTVVECEPGRHFTFRVTAAGMQVADWSYVFEQTAEGCRVTESWTDRRGPLIRMMARPVTGVADRDAHNRSGMEETLRRLKAAAESGPTAV